MPISNRQRWLVTISAFVRRQFFPLLFTSVVLFAWTIVTNSFFSKKAGGGPGDRWVGEEDDSALTLPEHPLWFRNFSSEEERNSFLVEVSERDGQWLVVPRSRVYGGGSACQLHLPQHQKHAGNVCDWLQMNKTLIQRLSAKLTPPLFFEDSLGFISSFAAIPPTLNRLVNPRECILSSDDAWVRDSNALDNNNTITNNTADARFLNSYAIHPHQSSNKVGGILFVGHSHVRYLSTMLCVMLGGNSCHLMGNKKHFVSEVVFPPTPSPKMRSGEPFAPPKSPSISMPPIVYLQSRYNSTKGITLLRKALGDDTLMPITHVVYGRGAWDMLYRDVSPGDLVEEILEELHHFEKLLPNLKHIILYPTHYQHLFRAHSKTPRWERHLKTCKSNTRQIMSSTIGHCVVDTLVHHYEERARIRKARYEKKLAKVDTNALAAISRASITVSALNVWEATYSPFAAHGSDNSGHHYMDGVLEGIVQILLTQHVCSEKATSLPANVLAMRQRRGGDTQMSKRKKKVPGMQWSLNANTAEDFAARDHSHRFSSKGTHCSRVIAASSNFTADPQCSCHREEYLNDANCVAMRIHLARLPLW